MGILRGGDATMIDDLIATLVRAGLETLEVTLNTPEALAMIRRARQVAGNALMVGAGTVMLALTSAGLVCYGIWMLLHARYARLCQEAGKARQRSGGGIQGRLEFGPLLGVEAEPCRSTTSWHTRDSRRCRKPGRSAPMR